MNTINLNLVNGYKIKSLSTYDCNTVEKLCKKCSDYYILVDGVLPSIEEVGKIFTDLPPNKSYEDKFVLGIFTYNDKLVGIVDLIRDYPTAGEWMLGLMIIDSDERGNGLGTMAHKALSEWAISLGAKTFRIGVVQENYRAIKFWSGLGYIKIKEVDMEFKAKKHIVDVMRLQF
ncbi:MAG: GNAT family N-acetyltransferase [Clostridiales bacterium]|uniref:GNAT family N-acetyltransferase n=1 Tax=Clostridium sp. N3C TaxID=1776758 RepID=UPI00092DFD34|nr:GNAT family N-acetyltransferase [Clostridium sp. N3C]NLZ49579.1 GNAT family N-acetyltransferase [Clostridiales bacterium]SCN24416.1 Acetyltransferase (GNAT) family protein [Clostridium sp. N3C]